MWGWKSNENVWHLITKLEIKWRRNQLLAGSYQQPKVDRFRSCIGWLPVPPVWRENKDILVGKEIKCDTLQLFFLAVIVQRTRSLWIKVPSWEEQILMKTSISRNQQWMASYINATWICETNKSVHLIRQNIWIHPNFTYWKVTFSKKNTKY